MRRWITWILVSGLMGLSAAARASDSQAERVSLTGLTPISVVVEGLAPVAVQNGLTAAALQDGVERRLKQAGIAVTPDADAYLYVHVTVADPGSTSPLPYVVAVALMQEVTLPRSLRTRTPLQCETWGLNRLGLSSAGLLRTVIGDRINEFVDQFIRAYQSVNPK